MPPAAKHNNAQHKRVFNEFALAPTSRVRAEFPDVDDLTFDRIWIRCVSTSAVQPRHDQERRTANIPQLRQVLTQLRRTNTLHQEHQSETYSTIRWSLSNKVSGKAAVSVAGYLRDRLISIHWRTNDSIETGIKLYESQIARFRDTTPGVPVGLIVRGASDTKGNIEQDIAFSEHGVPDLSNYIDRQSPCSLSLETLGIAIHLQIYNQRILGVTVMTVVEESHGDVPPLFSEARHLSLQLLNAVDDDGKPIEIELRLIAQIEEMRKRILATERAPKSDPPDSDIDWQDAWDE